MIIAYYIMKDAEFFKKGALSLVREGGEMKLSAHAGR